ncbi:MAG: site-specific DNA-methyltransferase [bacterium]|nr:site-specific DNA-methyltransferase [bacterium]
MKYFERSGAALRCGTAAMLDEQSGSLSGGHYPKARTPNTIYGGGKGTSIEQGTEKYSGDKGGASRFFYCAKASKKDRTMGGRVENRHPTVKPTEIMRWLVRLVKMPEGTLVLDPFAGSGSTGVACALEGVDFLGVERDEDSHATAVERVRLAREDTTG